MTVTVAVIAVAYPHLHETTMAVEAKYSFAFVTVSTLLAIVNMAFAAGMEQSGAFLHPVFVNILV